MIKQKLLHRLKEVCGTTGHMMKDKLIVGEHQVDGTRLLIYILFIPYCLGNNGGLSMIYPCFSVIHPCFSACVKLRQ